VLTWDLNAQVHCDKPHI